MPRLEPFDVDFFDSAPQRHSYVLDLPVSPERVWRGLAASNPLWWCRLLSSVEYTSPRPFGVGTTRTAAVLGVLRLREVFIRWEEGRRQSFAVDSANLPVFRRFGEDYLVERSGEGCRLTWTFAYEPAFKVGGRLNAVVFGSLVADTKRHFSA
ncbi:polyketide cyclase/dehydrase/lipid transport protein [Saccharothrix carnea]|uniref:Polyketide cyclase/dehydrase/lipid transport protein n=1 Tax=Saccharothrix carnea TaxID=1280637 RepID=A0A2P8IEM9_SACCR|nr:SRPBCC family protein [Saccharothrix carnea]PSL56928.1 polyketide cyclase/dehydrase/lipid transport protein [Saccharothrix carnea]